MGFGPETLRVENVAEALGPDERRIRCGPDPPVESGILYGTFIRHVLAVFAPTGHNKEHAGSRGGARRGMAGCRYQFSNNLF